MGIHCIERSPCGGCGGIMFRINDDMEYNYDNREVVGGTRTNCGQHMEVMK